MSEYESFEKAHGAPFIPICPNCSEREVSVTWRGIRYCEQCATNLRYVIEGVTKSVPFAAPTGEKP